MHKHAVSHLRQQAETIAPLSLRHLTRHTRLKLARDELSVNAYPAAGGGLVYVGTPRYRIPTEADLAEVFEVAEAAGVTWLMFDPDAAVIDGLPLFGEEESST